MCCYNLFRYGYTSSACSNSAQDFSVYSTLKSMSRDGLSRPSLTVGPGSITMFKAKDVMLCLSTRELIKKVVQQKSRFLNMLK